METIVSWAGLVITSMSLVYAILTTRDKHRLERVISCKLLGVQSAIAKIRNNPKMAHEHLDELRRYLNQLPKVQEMQIALDKVAWEQADSAVTDRLLEQLSDDVGSLRDGLFPELVELRSKPLELP